MMKKSIQKILAGVVAGMCLMSFTACSDNKSKASEDSKPVSENASQTESQNSEGGKENYKKVIKIASIAFNHDEVAAKAAVDKLHELGYDAEFVVLENATVMNEATLEGSIDTSLHQHKPWMDNYNAKKGTNFIMVEPYIHCNEYSIMSLKYDSVDELPDGATITISDDGSNQARALLFLKELGLITLKEGVTVPTTLDIEENPHNFNITPVQHHQVVKTMPDVDACMTSTYLLLSNNVSMDTIMASSEDYKDYGVGFVIKEENKDEEWVKALTEAYTTDAMRDKIIEIFKGGFVPGF